MQTNIADDLGSYFNLCAMTQGEIKVDGVTMASNVAWRDNSVTMSHHLPLLHVDTPDVQEVDKGMYLCPKLVSPNEQSAFNEQAYNDYMKAAQQCGMLLFNLHGSDGEGDSGFYGEGHGSCVESFNLDMLKQSNGRVLNTVACFGARFMGYERNDSMLLSSMLGGGYLLIAVIDAIKRADPNMKIVMAGLTGLDLKYLKDMDAEFKRRGKQWPDVINCHYYTHEGNKYGVWPPKWWNSGATFPENDKGFPYISEVIKFCESINRPLWITEFGCDSKPPSWMHIDGSKYGMTDEQAQGRLLVETYKAYFAAGVERCYSFMAADEPGSNGGLWQTSGILRNEQ